MGLYLPRRRLIRIYNQGLNHATSMLRAHGANDDARSLRSALEDITRLHEHSMRSCILERFQEKVRHINLGWPNPPSSRTGWGLGDASAVRCTRSLPRPSLGKWSRTAQGTEESATSFANRCGINRPSTNLTRPRFAQQRLTCSTASKRCVQADSDNCREVERARKPFANYSSCSDASTLSSLSTGCRWNQEAVFCFKAARLSAHFVIRCPLLPLGCGNPIRHRSISRTDRHVEPGSVRGVSNLRIR